MTAPTRYTRRVGALTLTVEPLFVAGHGEYPNTWLARVDVDVPEYATTANVAYVNHARMSPCAARARAFNHGHALLIAAIDRGIGQ